MDRRQEGKHRGRCKEFSERMEGAKTFRRKRAIIFLEHLQAKEATLKKQLETPELQTANPIIVGELKATQTIINEFVHQFELYEFDEYADLPPKKENEDE